MAVTTNPATPVRIVVDVTRRCNLSCYYCHSASGPTYRGPAIAGSRIGSILDAAERLGVFEVTITGGEPLMWDGLADLAEASKNLNFTSLQLITNATLVTDRMLDLLSSTKFRRICVSIDGPEDLHDAVRGPGRFAKTMEGIARLRRVVDNLTAITVVDRRNYIRWPELTQILLGAGVKQHHLTPVCFAGHAMEQYDDRALRDTDYETVVDILERLSPTLPLGFITSFKDGLLRPIAERSFTLSGFTCEYFKGHHVVIQPTGKVQRAARAWGRTWRADESVGNINHDDLYDILSNEPPTLVPLDFSEEMQRKYHIKDVTTVVVGHDLMDVEAVATGGKGDLSDPEEVDQTRIRPAALLNKVPLLRYDSLLTGVSRDPQRYRLRSGEDASLLFDTETFEIHILSPIEAQTISAEAVA